MRQPAVAHQNAESAGVQEPLACGRYSVHDCGHAHGILASVPARALQRETGNGGAIHVGKFVGFHIAAGLAHACEEPEAFDDLLFDAQARTGSGAVAANRRDVDGGLGGLGSAPGVLSKSVWNSRNLGSSCALFGTLERSNIPARSAHPPWYHSTAAPTV